MESKKEGEIYSELLKWKSIQRINLSEIHIDCQTLLECNPEVLESLINSPDNFISELKSAEKEISSFRLMNVPNSFCEKISSIRTKDINKIIKTHAMIKRVSKVVSRNILIKFECMSCGSILSIFQEHRRIKLPVNCSCSPGRNKPKFNQLPDPEGKRDIQEIILEETPDDSSSSNKQPQQIRVYLEGDLTDKTYSEKYQPGKKVEVIGIVREIPPFMNKKDEKENVADYMIHAININILEEDDDISISDEDLKKIKSIASDNPLEFLSHNISPNIYGYPEIKKALVLQMIKGTKLDVPGGLKTRSDTHILIVSDPGLGKTQMMKSVVMRAPRARYVSATRASGVGLTAMVKRDELTGDFSVEAGAVVLSNGSLVALDEIDKMEEENLSLLLEPMESQIVTLNKAGISCSLRSETSILASANPIRGKFSLETPLAQQINLKPEVLSRFDLIFVMADKQDSEYDKKLINKMFDNYINKSDNPYDCITPQFFKKYVAYTRKLFPKISGHLRIEIERIYLDIRKKTGGKGLPVTPRNADGLIRLATAHAKLRLSEEVEIIDLQIATELFLFTLKQFGFLEGNFDMSQMTEKVPVTKRGKMEEILKVIKILSEENDKIAPYHLISSKCKDVGIESWEVNMYLEQLGREGVIYEPKTGVYCIL